MHDGSRRTLAWTLFLSFDARCKLLGSRTMDLPIVRHAWVREFSLRYYTERRECFCFPIVTVRASDSARSHTVRNSYAPDGSRNVLFPFSPFSSTHPPPPSLSLSSISFFNPSPGFRTTFSIARTWREITLGIMRSAIFPRIHGRWKSSRNRERGTFANGDCTQCAHVGAAIPQLVTYVPLVTGGRSPFSQPLPRLSASLAPPSHQPQLLRQPLHSVRQTMALFIRRGISFEKLVGVDDENDAENTAKGGQVDLRPL